MIWIKTIINRSWLLEANERKERSKRDYLNSSSDDSDSGAATIGIRIGFGLAAYSAHKNKKTRNAVKGRAARMNTWLYAKTGRARTVAFKIAFYGDRYARLVHNGCVQKGYKQQENLSMQIEK